ncbi:MAG TPA: hypothetical protein VEG64_13290 [Candidatus Sulfotelmatobacter sp.]|nr:hypothetical protein [Candidatus Sulfotelmatobacter sp.]
MPLHSPLRRARLACKLLPLLALALAMAAGAAAQSDSKDKSNAPQQPAAQEKQPDNNSKPPDPGTARLRIEVTGNDKPIGNASVYVKFYETGGLFHKEKLAEMNFKTNEDGSVKAPDVPRGKVLIQVIAKGWHTYGKWYDVEEAEPTIQIKLVPPSTHWY